MGEQITDHLSELLTARGANWKEYGVFFSTERSTDAEVKMSELISTEQIVLPIP